MRTIKRIFIHCTAGSQKQTLDDLLIEFAQKGWKNPGYHYVVFPNGNVKQLLSEDKVSNGVQGYNSTAINVAYVGGIDNKGRAVDNRTKEQEEALWKLVKELKSKYPNATVMGHRDIWGSNPKNWKKQCPCFDVNSWYCERVAIENLQKPVFLSDVPDNLIEEKPKQSIWSKIIALFPWNKQ